MSSAQPTAKSTEVDIEDPAPSIQDTGITTIFDPSSSGKDTSVDLVFVHGLKGHPEKTWLHESKSSKAQQPSGDSARSSSRFRSFLRRPDRTHDKATSSSPHAKRGKSLLLALPSLIQRTLHGWYKSLGVSKNSEPTSFYKNHPDNHHSACKEFDEQSCCGEGRVRRQAFNLRCA